MKTLMTLLMLSLAVVLAAYTAPVISNVSSNQRVNGSDFVDIWYDLFDADGDLCTIGLQVSNNNGVSYTVIPSPANLSGHIGANQTSATGKHIIWNAGAESYDLDGSQYKFKISADDGTMPVNFIMVTGGTFHNGTSNVTVSSFYMEKYEVTQGNYLAIMGTNPATGSGVGTNFPVYYTSWFNAVEYCNRLSMQEGITPCYSYSSYGTNPANWPAGWNTIVENHYNVSCNWSAEGYRLPTEAEWQFAARGGNLTHNYTYSGGYSIESVAWYIYNASNTGHQVGTKAPNELGIYDMSGNEWEWCWDNEGNYPSGDQVNPHGSATGYAQVARGGSWSHYAYECTVAWRGYFPATTTYGDLGFRVVRRQP